MFAKLLPRSAPYFEYFRRQNDILREMMAMLTQILNGGQNAEANLKTLAKLESEADAIHHTIIHELSRTFITPIDREDIYAVSIALERTIDSVHGLGMRFFLFSFVHVRFPAKKMVDNMRDMATAMGDMLECLCAHTQPSAPVDAIQALKENCEMLVGVGLGELQDAEVTTFDQIKQIMAWVQLYERIEQTVERFAELTDTLEQAVLKYA